MKPRRKTKIFFYISPMKAYCLLVLLLGRLVVQGQKTEHYYDYNWKECNPELARYYAVVEKTDSLWVRTDYYLRESFPQMRGFYLDAESRIPHGTFVYYHPNKRMQGTGNFKNGKRDGLWLWYHENGMMSDSSFYKEGMLVGTSLRWYADGMPSDSMVMQEDGSGVKVRWHQNGKLSEAGMYSAGVKPNGKWKFYHSNGQLSAVEIYDKGRLVNKQYFNENGEVQDTTNRDREAAPLSIKEWKNYLTKMAYFPHHLKFNNPGEATVMIRFAVDEQGFVTEPYITYSLHPDIDKIVYETIEKAPRWLPAIDHNRTVKTYHTQPITFVQW
jgi:antitoxin component YwqK of YwqJK toxin-antitoxin module